MCVIAVYLDVLYKDTTYHGVRGPIMASEILLVYICVYELEAQLLSCSVLDVGKSL
jgi:hypothetical protein